MKLWNSAARNSNWEKQTNELHSTEPIRSENKVKNRHSSAGISNKDAKRLNHNLSSASTNRQGHAKTNDVKYSNALNSTKTNAKVRFYHNMGSVPPTTSTAATSPLPYSCIKDYSIIQYRENASPSEQLKKYGKGAEVELLRAASGTKKKNVVISTNSKPFR